MMLSGDEFAHTQAGNNNVYCQDNELSWINWDLKDSGKKMLEFTRRVVSLRQAYPMLRRGRFLVGEYNEELGVKDVTWLSPDGSEMRDDQWHDENRACLGMLLDGRAQPTGIHRSGADVTLLLIFNAHPEPVNFVLPEVYQGKDWICLIDTNKPEQHGTAHYPFGHSFVVTDRSLLLFKLRK
jgi:glycogen operon protein